MLVLIFLLSAGNSFSQNNPDDKAEENKEIARKFFDDLWFNNRTENYSKYVNETYVVHDIGDRKNVIENAVEQKEIADFFWENGKLKCELDYQIAEGNLVATRWIVGFEPETLIGKIMIGTTPLPIINVMRIENGKIVEFWNHRHDIDTPQTMEFTLKGLLIGLILSLIPTFYAIRFRRKLEKLKAQIDD